MKKIVERVIIFLLMFAGTAFGVEGVVDQVVLNTTQTLITNLTDLLVTAILGVITYYVKEFLQTNSTIKKYNLDNEKTERLLFNAISYAQVAVKKETDKQISKRELAIKYLERVDPATVQKYGDVLQDMLDRKVEQAKVEQKLRNQKVAIQ